MLTLHIETTTQDREGARPNSFHSFNSALCWNLLFALSRWSSLRVRNAPFHPHGSIPVSVPDFVRERFFFHFSQRMFLHCQNSSKNKWLTIVRAATFLTASWLTTEGQVAAIILFHSPVIRTAKYSQLGYTASETESDDTYFTVAGILFLYDGCAVRKIPLLCKRYSYQTF